jgi:hypothetical protein
MDRITHNDDFLEMGVNGLFLFGTLWTLCTIRSMRDTFRKMTVSALWAKKMLISPISALPVVRISFLIDIQEPSKNRFRLQGNFLKYVDFQKANWGCFRCSSIILFWRTEHEIT